MRNERAREEQTVTIATGLAIFMGILTAGISLLALVDALSDLSRGFDAFLPWIVATAAVGGGVYVTRHRR